MPDLEIIIGTQLGNAAASTTLTLEELITSMRASGMENDAIKSVLMNDLTQGGRLFGGYRSQVKNTVKNGMGMVANDSSQAAFEEAGVQQYEWKAIGDKSVCIDCERRAGEVGTMEYHKTIGVPRSGFSICQSNCRCLLIPATYKGEDLDSPLLRGKKLKKDPFVAPKPKRNNIVLRGYANASKQMEKYFGQIDFKVVASAKSYIKGDHKLINPILRGNLARTLTGKQYKKSGMYANKVSEGKKIIENLKKFCDTSPDYVGTVYRHVGFAEYGTTGLKKANKLADWFKENEGGLFSNKTFWSTSANSNLNYGGGGAVNLDFKIKSKTGTVLDGLNEIKNSYGVREDEILFAPNSQFKIKKVKKAIDSDGIITIKIDLEEI